MNFKRKPPDFGLIGQKSTENLQPPPKASMLAFYMTLIAVAIVAFALLSSYPNNDFALGVFSKFAASDDPQASSCADILYMENILTLPDVGEILTSRNQSRAAHFLFETSHTGIVSGRQACVVESAARNNPESDVYLIIEQPPRELSLKTNEQLIMVTRRYPNIQVLSLSSETTESEFLKFVNENGGTYLDWDVLITSDLGSLGPNFVCLKSSGSVSDRLFRLSKSHPLIKGAEGNLETRLKDYCELQVINKRRVKTCRDVSIYPAQFFYPIKAAGERDTGEILFGVNAFENSSRAIIQVGSNSFISEVAKTHCPRAYWGAYSTF
ncbi:uncharacterized protein LOC135940584 [Cloeon dipterum]|uniref:uncharacterized protein LOC135940584 n=1 Tax=Cloeon dipterum TaxID=197152 RepID=UPI00322068FA